MTRIPESIEDYPVRQWTLGEYPWLGADEYFSPATRVIIDNDFAGDPDDLYQLVHHLLCPSVEIPLIVASHLRKGDPFDDSDESAHHAYVVARDVFARMGITNSEIIVEAANSAIPDTHTPHDNPAVRAIIAEALRDDTDLPLFYAAGGGLTDLASALLIAPEIASRMTLLWIGGLEHDGLAYPPPNPMPIEYNLLIDVAAGQVVFDADGLEIWQAPRDIYRQCLVSQAELRMRVKNRGALGAYLFDALHHEGQRVHRRGTLATETYALGDSPLVLFTALRSLFEPDPASSDYVSKPTPELTSNGTYRPRTTSRPMRVYTQVDTRLMFEDMFLKIDEFVRWSESI